MKLLLLILLSCTLAGAAENPAARPQIPLWPQSVPDPQVVADGPEKVDRSAPGPEGFALHKNITAPRLVVFAPPVDNRTGAGCLVVPGGGFGILADEHEGSEACEWLATMGITAFLVVHRCPTNKHPEPNIAPVQDTQRGLMLVREKAAEFGVDPGKIGLLGFSAGGQVALVAATNPPAFPNPGPTSHRPDFLLLIYPWRIYDEKAKALRADVHLDAALPPLFLAQASDDASSLAQGSVLLYLKALELRKPGTPAPELHLYATGGHGFGMRPAKNGAPAPTDWPKRAADWLRALKLGK